MEWTLIHVIAVIAICLLVAIVYLLNEYPDDNP